MLPPVISEQDIFPFKFWFDGNIQDGMYYRNELYYRLYTVNISRRARLFHYGCKLASHSTLVLTTNLRDCSIWVSLRGQTASSFGSAVGLPSFEEFLAGAEQAVADNQT
ncbi:MULTISPECIES: hypothetical protein [unclassified Leptolyngbya]|uniref:hypothetical protein n=1 Tax=unclassified Leptolyngbya TaxID=2650499 RepID=UPI0016880294|nr:MULTISPECIES: hypothetical protein [unclassified Leptolyngbya]MBD1911971.1 hypothetical protein [Leptolyngbya sp. FACHB-8]MBD2157093.1 hypothetical protein [Leptolyngbya sp. FACHB-16]